MFERLLTLPLFQGMSLKELTDALIHVRLDFVNYQQGDEVAVQGDKCDRLIYIINGKINTYFRDDEGRFSVAEMAPRCDVIEPYNMFGMYQKFSRDYTFATEGVTFEIEKQAVLTHLMKHHLVKLNLLNIVCNKYQQTQRLLCCHKDITINDKIIRFFNSYTTTPRGEKAVTIKMTDLANLINETRLNVSIELNKMQDKGLLKLQRGVISIPALEDLKYN